MSSDQPWTAVKIRNKRNSTLAEKWRVGKRRRPELQTRRFSPENTMLSIDSNTSPESAASARKRTLKHSKMSKLEQLPNELIEYIFVCSGNVSLALSSPQLATQLSNKQLYSKMATRMLSPVLGAISPVPGDYELTNATRLLECRFVNWSWFSSWLRQAASTVVDVDENVEVGSWLWGHLKPSPDLIPPHKLFRSPFTLDKVQFLAIFTTSARTLLTKSHFVELAQEGLSQAVHEGSALAVGLLLSMGLKPITEHLRIAVADRNCQKDVIELLITKGSSESNVADAELSEFDLLDPIVWAWIDRAQAEGSEEAVWLKSYIQNTQGDHN